MNEKQIENLRIRQGELIRIVDALVKLDKSEEWNTLKELVFDKSLSVIEKSLLNEAVKHEIDTDSLYRLQGERDWAKRYTDINRFAEGYKRELEEIKKLLQ